MTEKQRLERNRGYQKKWREKNPDYDKQRYPDVKERLIAQSTAWAKANPERKADLARDSAARRRNDPAVRMKQCEASRLYRLKNKEKTRAHNKLNYAVRMGRIDKPDICSQCGKPARKIEAHHHHGYLYPFDVLWLCTSCHVNIRKL